jgi:hypothetical protein
MPNPNRLILVSFYHDLRLYSEVLHHDALYPLNDNNQGPWITGIDSIGYPYLSSLVS